MDLNLNITTEDNSSLQTMDKTDLSLKDEMDLNMKIKTEDNSLLQTSNKTDFSPNDEMDLKLFKLTDRTEDNSSLQTLDKTNLCLCLNDEMSLKLTHKTDLDMNIKTEANSSLQTLDQTYLNLYDITETSCLPSSHQMSDKREVDLDDKMEASRTHSFPQTTNLKK
jgi:hypothetical protein